MPLTDYVIMPGADYQAACDKLREKSGKTDPIRSGDLASEIEAVSAPTGGVPLPFAIVSDIPENHVVVMVEGIEFTTECIEEVEEENVDG